ncbi:YndM family protein [Virgibacillus sp. FSP13]
MDHLKVLGMKFIAIAITVFSIFGIFYNATLVNMFWISLFVTGISYLIGDMFILRKFGNVAASIADFPLAFFSLWALGSLFIDGGLPIITLSLLGAFFISICEPFIHAYIVENFSFERHDLRTMNQLQTEFSEEIDPHTDKKEDE